MSIADTDLAFFWAANRPANDSGTVGGAIDATMRPDFTQLAANDAIEMLSDGADTRTATVRARTTAGAIVSVSGVALTGTTPVSLSGLGTIERILSVVLSTTSGTRTVTFRRTTGAVVIRTVPPNEKGFGLLFDDSTSESSDVERTEKVHGKNLHSTLTLTSAKVRIVTGGDPSGVHLIAVEDAINDASTLANRKADKATLGLTFVDDGVQQSVPSGDLVAGASIGVWVNQALSTFHVAIRSTLSLELAGSST